MEGRSAVPPRAYAFAGCWLLAGEVTMVERLNLPFQHGGERVSSCDGLEKRLTAMASMLNADVTWLTPGASKASYKYKSGVFLFGRIAHFLPHCIQAAGSLPGRHLTDVAPNLCHLLLEHCSKHQA